MHRLVVGDNIKVRMRKSQREAEENSKDLSACHRLVTRQRPGGSQEHAQ